MNNRHKNLTKQLLRFYNMLAKNSKVFRREFSILRSVQKSGFVQNDAAKLWSVTAKKHAYFAEIIPLTTAIGICPC